MARKRANLASLLKQKQADFAEDAVRQSSAAEALTAAAGDARVASDTASKNSAAVAKALGILEDAGVPV